MAVGRRRTPQAPRSEGCAVRRALRPAVVALAALALLLAAASGCVEEDATAPTREAEPLQTPAHQPTEQVTPLPTTMASATPPSAPTGRPGMTTEVTPANDSGAAFVQVSAGPFHTCGLRADGTITCWGAHGEDERLTESAGLLDSPPGVFSQIEVGHYQSCAIRQDGAVKCWGSMSIEGDDIPPEAKAMMEAMWAPPEGRFISVGAGFLFSCGVRDDNTAECWGPAASLSDALTPPAGEYTSVSVGGFHACGIRTDQAVVCWGSNEGFDGDFLGQATPPEGQFEVINAGGYHTCGFRPDGEIRCWGGIVGGYGRTCEPQPDGTSRCWTDERVKDADQAWGGNPDSAPDGTLKAIDSGQGFSCALWDGGHIGCWGVRWHQRPAATGHLRGGHRRRGARLRTAPGWQHRMLGKRCLRTGQSAMMH